jgi:hypothetical protein
MWRGGRLAFCVNCQDQRSGAGASSFLLPESHPFPCRSRIKMYEFI